MLRTLLRRLLGRAEPAALVFPYGEVLYQLPPFREDVSVEEIRRRVPEGRRRVRAFERACRQLPGRADLWLALVEARLACGIHDDVELGDCIDVLQSALRLEVEPRLRDQIEELVAQTEEERAVVIAEVGESSPEALPPDSLAGLARAGRVGELRKRLSRLKAEIQPTGILGAKTDRELWETYQATIRALFLDRQPEAAVALAEEFSRRRIGVGLTPIPDHGVQELLVGYLLQVAPTKARRTITTWLANSRMPIVCDAVRQHPELADLFDDVGAELG